MPEGSVHRAQAVPGKDGLELALSRWSFIVLDGAPACGLYEQVELEDESDAHAFATAHGLPGLLQLLFQRVSLRHRRLQQWIILRARLPRIKLRHSRPSQRKQQHDQEQLPDARNNKELPEGIQQVEESADTILTTTKCQHYG